MQQFYTSIETENGRYIGVVYNSNNNVVEYRTKAYSGQMQALMDVSDYLKKKENPTNSKQQIITNTAVYKPVDPSQPRRCCGR